MSRIRRASFVFLLAASLVAAQAPPDVVTAVARESETNSQVMAHLDHLTNKIGPRLTGSERLTQAVEWARDRFKSFGIENARLEEWGTIEVGFDRGVHSGFLKAKGETTPLVFGTNAWTPGTDGMKEGPAILAPDDEAGLDAFRAKAKGAWIVRPPRCHVTKEVNEICEKEGGFGTVANGGELILTSGNHRTKWSDLPKLVRINLHKPQYEDLVKRLQAGEALTLGFDVQNRFKQGPVTVFNVLADIPGTEKPDEMVIVGGHIDSWDGATGTTDNGTGVATTLEAARLLMAAGAKPKRTIRFMLWSGEEEGLLGSAAWIKKHPEALDNISAVVVHDGGTNYVSGIQSTEDMLPMMKTALAPVIALLGQKMEESVDDSPQSGRGGPFGESRPGRDSASRPAPDESMKFVIRQVGSLPRGVGSDHDSFLARGVPGFFWRQAGRANYTHTHHTQYDTYAAAISEYQKHSAKVIALGALGLANLAEKLPRPKETANRSMAPNRRRLGIQIGEDDLTIEDVVEGGRAEAAGLKVGDRIVKIDDIAVKDRTQMSDALNVGSSKKVITYLREKKEKQVTIEFSEGGRSESRPDSRSEARPTSRSGE
jgi:carboxypeptidase Q